MAEESQVFNLGGVGMPATLLLETLLVESCCLLNSYTDIMTWDEELNTRREELYAKIEACLKRSVHPVP